MSKNKVLSVKRRDERGMALLLSLMAVLVIAAAAALIMMNVSNSSKNTNFAVNDTQLEEACKAGIDMGIERVWHEYVIGNGNTTGNVASYRTFINNIVANNETLNGVTQDYNGDGVIDSNSPATLIASNAAVTLQSGAKVIGLEASRCDDIGGVRLTFTATAQIGSNTKSVTQAVRVGGSPFAGFEFAVLANNINCILCHAEFKSNDMYKLSNGAIVPKTGAEQPFNSTDRVKVAALESLLIRTNEADSRTSGSLYSRGSVYTSSGTLLNAAGIASAFTTGGFGAYAFSNTNGKITQDATSGNMTKCALTNASVSNGCPAQFANLYLNYPSNTDQMTDGPLPQSFPAPFPDDNGNRKVDTTEFQKVMNTANGKITNGIAYGVASGQTYSGTALPAASSSGTMQQLASGKYSGNLILVGTSATPITIDKQVAVDGDVVIKGPIKGYGQLMVSGNVYVVGDVTYADAAGQFGVASDGTANAFALEAGGNIMMGDYVSVRARNNYVTAKVSGSNYTDTVDTGVWQGRFVRVDQNTGYNVTMNNADLNPSGTSPVAAQKTGIGYFDSGVVDPGIIPTGAGTVTSTTTYTVGSGSSKQTHTLKSEPESQASFTTSELMLFNRMEHQKWAPPGNPDYNANVYTPGYVPRYYQLRDTAQVLEYRVTSSTDSNLVEHCVDYASPGVTPLVTTTSSSYYQGAGAAVLSLAPKNGWISETTLRQIWYNDEAARRASPTYVKTGVSCSPFRFDGLLYTNNAIFGVIRSNGRHGSQMYGKLWVRGAIVCADLGLLSTDNSHTGSTDAYYGGVQVYYDKRVKAFLNVVDPTKVQFTRLAYQPRAGGSGG